MLFVVCAVIGILGGLFLVANGSFLSPNIFGYLGGGGLGYLAGTLMYGVLEWIFEDRSKHSFDHNEGPGSGIP